MTAWRADNGNVAWSSDALLYRGLTAPAVQADSVVYGDAEGLVHWLSRRNGDAQLRLPTDGNAVAAAPVAAGLMLLVVTRTGGIFAFRAP